MTKADLLLFANVSRPKGDSKVKESSNQPFQDAKAVMFMGFLMFSLVFSGCVSSTNTASTMRTAEAVSPLIRPAFFSEDYVLHQLKDNQNIEELARHYLGSTHAAWKIIDANPGKTFDPGDLLVIPLKEDPLGGLAENGYQTVPILCYHRFKSTCNSSLCVSTTTFEAQMAYLKANGFQTISLSTLYEFTRFKKALPPKSVVITIDDGYLSGYTIAAPILKKYGFRATFFIYTDFVGASKNAVTWEQLRELKSQGFEIGSHTLSHVDLNHKMPNETDEDYSDRIRQELAGSKVIIDKHLEQETQFIAWPFGRYNTRVLELSEQSGYVLGFSVDRGGNPFFQDPMAFKRDQILSGDMNVFLSRLKIFTPAELR